jgi:hypothetical protein
MTNNLFLFRVSPRGESNEQKRTSTASSEIRNLTLGLDFRRKALTYQLGTLFFRVETARRL